MFKEKKQINIFNDQFDKMSDLELIQTLQREATALLENRSRHDGNGDA